MNSRGKAGSSVFLRLAAFSLLFVYFAMFKFVSVRALTSNYSRRIVNHQKGKGGRCASRLYFRGRDVPSSHSCRSFTFLQRRSCESQRQKNFHYHRPFNGFRLYSVEISEDGKETEIRAKAEKDEESELEMEVEDQSTAYDVILDGLNNAQVEAVTQPLESITRVVAGPGAGKTRVLTCRIAYLLKKDDEDNSGRRNSRILAVTFTKKASGEMQHRLESLLEEDDEYQRNILASTRKQNSDQETNYDDYIYEEVVQQDGSSAFSTGSSSMITRVSLGTFHSICSKILRWNGSELGKLPSVKQYRPKDASNDVLDGSFAIVDQSEQMRIIKKCLSDCGIDLKGSGRGKPDIRSITILNAVGQLKSDDALEVDSRSTAGESVEKSNGIKMTAKVRQITEEVYPMYRRELISQNALDFDDLILLTRELLKCNEEVRERMARRWQHVLVDEFQDTSEVQLDLVKLLSTTSLMVVGDGDQSIYSWRGAHAESMADFVGKFDDTSEKKVDTVYLMENYRSTTNIVNAAQKVINDKSTSGSNSAIRQDMKPMRGKGPSPRVLACADAKAEASFVVNEISKMVDSGMLNSKSTIALIYRTNAQSRALEEACVAGNLKYLVRGSAGTFYSRAEIKDCLCFLKWLYNGRDKTAMTRAMKTPSRGLGDVSLNEFTTYCDEVGRHVFETDPHGPQPTPIDILLSLAKIGQGDDRSYLPVEGVITKRTLNKLLPFAVQMNQVSRKAQSQTVSDLLRSIMDIMGLKPHFDAISKTSDEFADRWANVMELLNASERYSQDGACMERKQVEIDGELTMEEMSPLGNFLDDVSLLTETEAANSDDDDDENSEGRAVANLMTIHASKGMEFDSVFLVGNEESTFPTQRAIMEGEGSVELDEERRLCYVAMTRAKTHLIMTWRKEVTTFFGQGFKVSKPERSRFLDALVKKKAKKSNKPVRIRKENKYEDTSFDLFPSAATKKMKSKRRVVKPRRDLDPLRPKAKLLKAKKKIKVSRAQPRMSSAQKSEFERDAAKNMLKKRAEVRQAKELYAKYGKRPETFAPAVRQRSPPPKSTSTGRRDKSTVARRSSRLRPQNASVSSNASQKLNQPPVDLDSTMFYSIGTKVKHAFHGEGKVVQPPPASGNRDPDALFVHVKFDSGMDMDFPVGGSGLTIKY